MKVRFKRHYFPMLILSAVFCVVYYLLREPALPIIPYIVYTSGYISIFLLAVSLLIGPINLIYKRKNPISTNIRRDVGIFGGFLGVVHCVLGFFMHFTGKPWLYFVKEVGETFVIRSGNFGLANYTGLFGGFILILLLIISNDYYLGKLKASKWKNLQRFAYPMFLLVILHSIFYRLNMDKAALIMYLYLPIFLLVLTFQLIGIRLKTRKSKKT